MHRRHVTTREKRKRTKQLIAKRTTVAVPHLNTEDVHILTAMKILINLVYRRRLKI